VIYAALWIVSEDKMALVEVVKWNGQKGVYAIKHPATDLGTWTQLIVQETQEAMLMKEGQYFGPFAPGRHTLDTKNFPLLEKFMRIPFGGKTPFTAEVWYVNKSTALDVKWGTSSSMQLKDPEYNIMLPVRAFGQFGIKISETKKFLEKLVGTLSVFSEMELTRYFKGIVLTRTKDLIAEHIMHKKISILEISAHLSDISELLEAHLSEEFSEFGIGLTKFRVMSISTPESDPAVQQLKAALSKRAEMNILGYNYQQERSFEVMEAAAGNEGGSGAIMGAGMGAGMGIGMGAAMGGQMGGMMGQLNTTSPPPAPNTNPFGGQTVEFFVHMNGQQMGPFPIATLKQGTESGQFTKQTSVWREGMSNWLEAGQVPELQSLFAAKPPSFGGPPSFPSQPGPPSMPPTSPPNADDQDTE
jgi:membrane protease subunit (stomatin/prohibitin family)